MVRYCKIPLRLVTIEGDGYHLMVSAVVNGKKANMLIDTGASKTVFDLNRIPSFLKSKKKKEKFERFPQLSTGLGTNSLESHVTQIDKFQIGKYVTHDFQAILLDLAHVNETYELLKIRPIDGVIGSDLLVQLKAQINFLSKTLKIYF
jgi:hypothetical protein